MQDNYAPYAEALRAQINRDFPEPQVPAPVSEAEERAHTEAAAQYSDYDARSLTSIANEHYRHALRDYPKIVAAEAKKYAEEVTRIMRALEDYYAHHHLPRPDSFRRLAQAYLFHCEMNREDIPREIFCVFSQIALPEQVVQEDDHDGAVHQDDQDAERAARELADDHDEAQEAARQIADAEDAAIAAGAREHQRNILERCRLAYAGVLTPEQDDRLEEIIALYAEKQSLEHQIKIAKRAHFQTLATGSVKKEVGAFLATGNPTAEEILERYTQALDDGVPQQNAIPRPKEVEECIQQNGAFYLITQLRQIQQTLIAQETALAQATHARPGLPAGNRRSHAEHLAEEETAANQVLKLIEDAIAPYKRAVDFRVWGGFSNTYCEDIKPLAEFKKNLEQAFKNKGLLQEPAAAARSGASGSGSRPR